MLITATGKIPSTVNPIVSLLGVEVLLGVVTGVVLGWVVVVVVVVVGDVAVVVDDVVVVIVVVVVVVV